MKRRTFIQGMAVASAALAAQSAIAQPPSPEAIQNARNQLIDAFAKKIELE